MAMPTPPSDTQLRDDAARIDAIIARPRTAAAISEIKDELGTTMNRNVAVFRDEAGLRRRTRSCAASRRRRKTAYIDDRGTVFNQDVLGAIELGYMLDCAEAIVVAADRAQGVARRAVPHRLPRAQRRGVAQAHRHHAQRRRRAARLLLAGDDHAVAARGAQVLTRWPEFTLRIRRYDPESGEPPYWDEHTIELEPHRSVLEGILQAKARFDGSIGIRCSCRAAICGSCGVRINGQPGLACHTHLDARAAQRARTASSRSSRWATCPSSRT